MGFHEMFEQVPTKPPYDKDPTGKPQVWVFIVSVLLSLTTLHLNM